MLTCLGQTLVFLTLPFSSGLRLTNVCTKVWWRLLKKWCDNQVYILTFTHSLHDQGNPYYSREIRLMGELKVKAEIEALNSAGFDTLEQRITTKILRKSYF